MWSKETLGSDPGSSEASSRSAPDPPGKLDGAHAPEQLQGQAGQLVRMIVATHSAGTTTGRMSVERDGIVSALFRPQGGFTGADVGVLSGRRCRCNGDPPTGERMYIVPLPDAFFNTSLC